MGFLDSNSTNKQYNDAKNAGFSDLDHSSVSNLQGITTSGKNSSTSVVLTDGGAVKSAFDFANNQSSQAYDFSRDLTSRTATQIGSAIQAVSESARSESENILINLQKYAVYAFVVWGVVQVFKGGRNAN